MSPYISHGIPLFLRALIFMYISNNKIGMIVVQSAAGQLPVMGNEKSQAPIFKTHHG